MREDGWYWVKIKALSTAPNIPGKFSSYPDWTPAEWYGKGNYFWLDDEDYSEDKCAAIHPERIKNPDE